MERTYQATMIFSPESATADIGQDAISLLDSRRRKARPTLSPNKNLNLEMMPVSQANPRFRGAPSLTGMKNWLRQLGHSVIRS